MLKARVKVPLKKPAPDYRGPALFKKLPVFIEFFNVLDDAFIRRQDAAFINSCGKVDGDDDGDDDD